MPNRHFRKRTLEEVIRDLDDRITRLELRTNPIIGTPPNAYVLERNAGGQLTARNTTTNTVTVIAVP